MSPASQTGNFHVDRYIGSYLISNTTRNGHKILDYDGSGGQTKAPPKHSQYIAGPNIFRGGYGPSDAIFCPPPFCQNRSNWAGIPLISTANSRRNGKPLSPATSRPSPHSPQFQHQRMHIVNPPACNIEYNEGQNLPLSKLALHARGAPLILSRRYNNNNGNRKHNQYQNPRPNIQPPNRVNTPDVAKKTRDIPKENRFEFKEHTPVSRTSSQNGLTLNIDSLSVASDESSGSAHSETCLPRIIKPRKRRKKDRKPLTASGSDKPLIAESKSESNEQNRDNTVASHNKLTSVNRDKTDINHNSSNFKPLQVSLSSDYAHLYDANKNDICSEWKFLNSKVESNSTQVLKSPNSRSISLEDDESDDSSSLFEAISRCSPTICQCRYCDPSSQVWDIDQQCYSPNLKAPLEADLDPNKNILMEKDTVLRRSWSEPCPGYSVENLRISDIDRRSISHHSNPNISSCNDEQSWDKQCKSVGVIGAGRRTIDSNKTPSTPDWKEDVSPKFQIVPGTIYKSSSSHGVSLEVSSAIVTSLNGHRDLEIKFFSSSPSATTVTESESFIYPNFINSDVCDSSVGNTSNKSDSTPDNMQVVKVQ